MRAMLPGSAPKPVLPCFRSGGDAADFLGECWALVEFVETSRTGGPARTLVEATLANKSWHISVHDGYTDQLQELLKTYYRSDQSLAASKSLRRRARQYIAGLEAGALKGTVDVSWFEAWNHSRIVRPDQSQA
jgi:hypothetical protein